MSAKCLVRRDADISFNDVATSNVRRSLVLLWVACLLVRPRVVSSTTAEYTGTNVVTCPSGTYPHSCEAEPANVDNGVYIDETDMSCNALSNGADGDVVAKVTCSDVETDVAVSGTDGYYYQDQQTLSVACPHGDTPISCFCYSLWGVARYCGSEDTFAPTGSSCEKTIPYDGTYSGNRRRGVEQGVGAHVQALCPATTTSTTTSSTTSTVSTGLYEYFGSYCVEGDSPPSNDACQSTVSCPEGLYPIMCEADPPNQGDGVKFADDMSCIADYGGYGDDMRAKVTCSSTATEVVVSATGDYTYYELTTLTVSCDYGNPIMCFCFTPWEVAEFCEGVDSFQPTGSVCSKYIPEAGRRRSGSNYGALITALCYQTTTSTTTSQSSSTRTSLSTSTTSPSSSTSTSQSSESSSSTFTSHSSSSTSSSAPTMLSMSSTTSSSTSASSILSTTTTTSTSSTASSMRTSKSTTSQGSTFSSTSSTTEEASMTSVAPTSTTTSTLSTGLGRQGPIVYIDAPTGVEIGSAGIAMFNACLCWLTALTWLTLD